MKKIILITLVALMGCQAYVHSQEVKLDIDVRIDQIIDQLSLEEKIKMCHAQSKFSVAGVQRFGIPEIWMSDGPHGVRAEIAWDSWSYAG